MAKEKAGVIYTASSEISMHGFSHLVPEVSNKVRWFWICVIAVACVGTGLHLYSLIDLYFQYDYYESVKIEQDILEFPDLTLCSAEAGSQYNMYKNPKITAELLQHIMKALYQWYNLAAIPDNNVTMEDIAIMATYTPSFANLGYEKAAKISTVSDELVVHCKFQNKNCSHFGKFVLYFHHIFGSCYTFSMDKERIPEIKPGPEEGLSLILKANQQINMIYDLASKVTSVSGLKVVIHERGTIPPILRNAIDVAPGTSTNIGLIMKKFKRLNVPYGNCYEGKEFAEQNKFVYSTELCERHVKYLLTKEVCKCDSVQYRNSYHVENVMENCFYSDFSTSSILSVQRKVACGSSLNSSVWGEQLEKCPWSCDQTEYDVSISETYWPQENKIQDFIFVFISNLSCESPVRFYYEYILNRLTNNSNHTKHHTKHGSTCRYEEPSSRTVNQEDITQAIRALTLLTPIDFNQFKNSTINIEMDDIISTEDWIKKYFYRLNVYFSKPTVEIHRQVISFSLTDLWSSVGGVVGLWCGFSFITFVEIVWFLARLVASKTDACSNCEINSKCLKNTRQKSKVQTIKLDN